MPRCLLRQTRPVRSLELVDLLSVFEEEEGRHRSDGIALADGLYLFGMRGSG
jgi:hypothetical protein